MRTFFILVFVILCYSFPSHVHCEVLWEKEFTTINFVESKVSGRLFEYNRSYFILYYGMDTSTAKKINGKWVGNKYTALMKFDKNGNTIFQNERVIPMIDSLIKAKVELSQELRGIKFNDNELLCDIPQSAGAYREPNIYRFSTSDGSLIGIEGTFASNYEPLTMLKSIFSDNELFVLAAGFLNFNQSRIDVHNQIGDEFGSTLKYRIALEMDSFKDSMPDETFAYDFLMADDHSFIVTFPGKEGKYIIAKYSYDKEEASKLTPGGTITADLDWYSIYKPATNSGYNQFQWLNNGNLLVHSGYGSITIFNNNGELIFNKKVFDDSYNNYTINNFMPLKYHAGYYAFWGYYIENSERNFAVIITDSDWNVVDAIRWDYNGKSNSVNDIKETDDGNLIVLGNSLYTEINESGTNYLYIPYYAEIKPNYVSVHEQKEDDCYIVSPQPANDYINISNINYGENIEIYNLLGTKQFETIYNGKINISNLPVGVYYLKAGSETAKFVKM